MRGHSAHEVGVVIDAVCPTPEAADTLRSLTRSTLLHLGYPARIATAGNLYFPFSPSDLRAGAVYEFSYTTCCGRTRWACFPSPCGSWGNDDLADIALVVRSKNTSPSPTAWTSYSGTPATTRASKSGRLIDAGLIAGLYGIDRAGAGRDLLRPGPGDQDLPPRAISSGAPGDRDVYGAQQHAPLLLWQF